MNLSGDAAAAGLLGLAVAVVWAVTQILTTLMVGAMVLGGIYVAGRLLLEWRRLELDHRADRRLLEQAGPARVQLPPGVVPVDLDKVIDQ